MPAGKQTNATTTRARKDPNLLAQLAAQAADEAVALHRRRLDGYRYQPARGCRLLLGPDLASLTKAGNFLQT
jgi:hypothetical protein